MNNGYLFMIYSHKDKERVIAIRDFLVENGIHVWDDTQLLQGDNEVETIATKILDSNTVLAVVSNNFMESAFCTKEIKYATYEKKPIILALDDNIDMPAGYELLFSDLEHISLGDFQTNAETRERFLALVRRYF